MPSYQNYLYKSRIASALGILDAISRTAELQYQEDHDLNTIKFGDISFGNGIITGLDAPPVVNALYVPPGGNEDVAENEFLVCVFVGKLGFSGYVAPTPGVAGTYSRVCKMQRAGDNIFSGFCGAWDGSNIDIPVDHLPETCSCSSIIDGC